MTDMETLRRYLSDAEVKMSGFMIRQEDKIKERHKGYLPQVVVFITVFGMFYGIQKMFMPDISFIPTIFEIFLGYIIYWIFFWISYVSEKTHNKTAAVKFIKIAIVFAFAVSAAALRRYIMTGGISLVNEIVAAYNSHTGNAVDYFAMPENMDNTMAFYIFYAYFIVLVSLYAGLIIRMKKIFFIIILWLLFFMPGLIFKMPVCTFIAAMMIVSVFGSFAYINNNAWNEKIYARVLVAFTMILAVMSSVFTHNNIYRPSQLVTNAKRQVIKKTEETRFGKSDTPEGNTLESIKYGEQKRLKMKISGNAKIYLRGFTGCKLEGDVWEESEGEIYGGTYEGMFKGYEKKKFHPLAQIGCYGRLAYSEHENALKIKKESIEIDYSKANKKYLYLPYGIDYENLLKTDGTGNINHDISVTNDFFNNDNINRLKAEVYVCDYEKLLDNIDNDWLYEKNSDWISEYRSSENDYNKFVKKNYLEIPAQRKKIYKNLIDKIGSGNVRSAVDNIRKYISALKLVNNVKDKSADKSNAGNLKNEKSNKPDKNDCTENNNGKQEAAYKAYEEYKSYIDGDIYSLYDGNMGTVQYVTEAVLLFRGAGIPARYVEGYEAENKSGRGMSVEVSAQDAAAWVEIYREGIGWIPVEIFTSASDKNTESRKNKIIEQKTKNTITEEQKNNNSGGNMGNNNSSDNKKKIYKVIEIIIICILVILLVVLIIIMIRIYLYRRKCKKILHGGTIEQKTELMIAHISRCYTLLGRSEEELPRAEKNIIEKYWFATDIAIKNEEYEVLNKYVLKLFEEIAEKGVKAKVTVRIMRV